MAHITGQFLRENFVDKGRDPGDMGRFLYDTTFSWDGDALLLMMGARDLNTSAQAWRMAYSHLHGLPRVDRYGEWGETNITPEQYDWALKQAENLGLPGQPAEQADDVSNPSTGYHTMSVYAGGLLSSGVPLPEPVLQNAIQRARENGSTTSTAGLASRLASGQFNAAQRRKVIEGVGWSQLLGQRGAWPDTRFSRGDTMAAQPTANEAADAWKSLTEASRRPEIGDELVDDEPVLGIHNLIDIWREKVPREAYGDLLSGKHPVFGRKDSADLRFSAIQNTPFPEHHQALLDEERQFQDAYMREHGTRAGVHGRRDIEHLLMHNQHIRPEFINDLADVAPEFIPYRAAGWVASVPGLRERLHQYALTSGNFEMAHDLIRNEVSTPQQVEELVSRYPALRSKLAETGMEWSNPDLFAEHKVAVAFGTNKLRQARDHILAQGKTELPPKDMPPGNWGVGRLPNGNISAGLLQQVIDNAPRIPYNVTHGQWEGAQRHSKEESNVFQLNVTADQVQKLKEAGVYDRFRKMHQASRYSGHPLGPTGIGWVRWTGGKKTGGIFIDEVQSDFGQSFIRQAAAQARQQGEDPDEWANAAEKEFGSEDEQEAIKNILFGGKHPSEVLQEAFHEWLRTPHKESPNEIFDNGRGECGKCGAKDGKWGIGPEGYVCREPTGLRGADCNTPFEPRVVDYVGLPIHIWQPESKAAISLGSPEDKLPGHFYVGYRDVPQKKMGFKPGVYGELETQTNKHHAAQVNREGPIYSKTCPNCREGMRHVPETNSFVCDRCGQDAGMENALLVGHNVELRPAKATWKDKVRKSEDQREHRPNKTFAEHVLPGSLDAEGYRLNIAHMPGMAIATVHRHGGVLGHVELVDWEPKEEWRDGEPYRTGLREAVIRVLEGHAKGKQEEDGWHGVTLGPHLLSKNEHLDRLYATSVARRKQYGARSSAWKHPGTGEVVAGRGFIHDPSDIGSRPDAHEFSERGYILNDGSYLDAHTFDDLGTWKEGFRGFAKAEFGTLRPETPRGFHAQPEGHQVTAPHPTYAHASQAKPKGVEATGGKNIWVRPYHESSNAGRTLMVQFSSDLLQGNRQRDASDDYYDNLYSKRQGYHRPADWWEVPQWQAHVAHSLPHTDHYTVRDPEEAVAFMKQAGYKNVAFSSLDVTAPFIKKLAQSLPNQRFVIGGYTDMNMYAEHPNVTVHPTVQSFVESEGHEYKPGYDYRHFNGVQVIPRLTLSDGCRHNCTFCCVPKAVTEVPMHVVEQQADAFAKDLNAELVYLNDKTFGQASNHAELPNLYRRIKAQNPNFKGFIIQTTAAQMKRMTPQFLRDAGIRHVELGIESFNNPILRAHKKPANEAIIEEAAQKIRDAGASLIPNIMIGLPGEDKETYGRTMDWLKRNRSIISHVNAYSLALYEESELGKKLQAVSAADRDENQQVKSWMTDPAVHKNFAEKLFQYANEQLDQPVGHISVGQTIGDQHVLTQPMAKAESVFNVATPHAPEPDPTAYQIYESPMGHHLLTPQGNEQWFDSAEKRDRYLEWHRQLSGTQAGVRDLGLRKAEDENPPMAASILVHNEHGQILWGRRRKDGKWTLPGGHLEPGEDPASGALRELFEEAGLSPESIHHFGTANTSNGIPVFMFHATVEDQQPHAGFDPDNEVAEWRWVDCLMGCPPDIRENLAHPKNVVLEHLGLVPGASDTMKPLEKMAYSDRAWGKDRELGYVSGLRGFHAEHYRGVEPFGAMFLHRYVHEAAAGGPMTTYIVTDTPPALHEQHRPVVGYFSGWERPNGFHLSTSVVHPEHQGHGVGLALYQHAIAKHGAVHSDSSVSPAARGLWDSLARDPGLDVTIGKPGTLESNVARKKE